MEEELGVVIYPGTEIMADTGRGHLAKSNHVVLVPQPSDDPSDPLNWNWYWKTITMVLATAVPVSQAIGPLSVSPMSPQLMEAFSSDLSGVIKFTGVCILILGFSNFFWVPVQNCIGRRPVLISSVLICMVSNIWRAVATSYGSFMGACILNGFGSGPAETAQPQIISDIRFLHERGAYNTLYFAFYWSSYMVGPIISGSMTAHVGWRSFWWLNVAFLGFVMILLIFLFPETKWDRRPLIQPAGESPTEMKLEQPPVESRLSCLGKGAPSKQQFKFWTVSEHPFKQMFMDFWIPWKLHLFPIVNLAGFIVSWSSSNFLMANITQTEVFAAPPYNFSSEMVGLFNVAMLVGAFIGLFTNGFLSDFVAAWFTRRNRGIREPEMRLPAMVPYVIVMIVGNFIIAYGYQYKWSWKVIVIIGYTAMGIQVASLPPIISTYAVDSYKPATGSIFVTITVNKNLWGYGFSEYIIPWTLRSGFVKPIMLNMCLTTLWCLCAIIAWFYGKTARKWTAKSDVHQL